MRQILYVFALLLCSLVAPGVVRAQGPSTTVITVPAAPAPDWYQVATDMLQRPEFAYLPLELKLIQGVPLGGSPVEMRLQTDRCTLQLRTRRNPVAEVLLAQAAPQDRTLWMQAVIVHEIAHCWRSREDDFALERLAALTSSASTADATQSARIRRALQIEESFADVAALAWIQQAAPERLENLLAVFERLRNHPSLSSGAHDTRAALARVRRGELPPDQPFFTAARALIDSLYD